MKSSVDNLYRASIYLSRIALLRIRGSSPSKVEIDLLFADFSLRFHFEDIMFISLLYKGEDIEFVS